MKNINADNNNTKTDKLQQDFADFNKFFEANQKQLVSAFKDFLKIKSISTHPEYRSDLLHAPLFLGQFVKNLGFNKIRLINKTKQIELKDFDDAETNSVLDVFGREKSNPVLVAEYVVNKAAPWMLVYGHYDVQPVDRSLWDDDPFNPVEKQGKIFARGASDNKGRLWASIVGLVYALQKKDIKYNVLLVVEGEEEVAGNTVSHVFEKIKQQGIYPKVLYFNDVTWPSNDLPSIMYSLRGVVVFRLKVKTGEHNVHSGLYGNIAPNAVQVANYVAYKLKDINKNRIRIERLMRLVRKSSKEEIQHLAKISPSYDQVQEEGNLYYVTKYNRKGKDFLPTHVLALRPSLDIHGFSGGYTGTGLKTIVPNTAEFTFSLRTVPYMDEEKIVSLVSKYIEKLLKKFNGLQYSLEVLAKAPYVYQDYNTEMMQSAKNAMSTAFGSAYFVPHSASNLAVASAKKVFDNAYLLMPAFGKPSHNIHGPNENIEIDMLLKGGFVLYSMLKY